MAATKPRGRGNVAENSLHCSVRTSCIGLVMKFILLFSFRAEWSACSSSCGNGQMKRIVKPDSRQGPNIEDCPKDDSVQCSNQTCPVPASSLRWTDWSQWLLVDDKIMSVRFRNASSHLVIEIDADGTLAECKNDQNATISCPTPSDTTTTTVDGRRH